MFFEDTTFCNYFLLINTCFYIVLFNCTTIIVCSLEKQPIFLLVSKELAKFLISEVLEIKRA